MENVSESVLIGTQQRSLSSMYPTLILPRNFLVRSLTSAFKNVEVYAYMPTNEEIIAIM